MINIHQSLGGAPVVFIRYNPDKYDKKKDPTMSTRMDTLTKWIKHFENPETFQEYNKGMDVSCIYLFFNGYKPESPEVVDVGRCAGL